MKKIFCTAFFAAAVISLCGCSDSGGALFDDESTAENRNESRVSDNQTDNNNSNNKNNSSNNNENHNENVKKSEFTAPVLYIKTKNQSSNALDFVTKPVAAHVSESIASWTTGYKIPPAPYYEECLVSMTGSDGREIFSNKDAKVKVRGNWTTSYQKKPLRIKFEQKQEMDGLNNNLQAKNWVLLAGYKDASLLRDRTVLALSREILGRDGLYAADSELVEVNINDEYRGVYLLTDMQQVNSGRVNISKAEKDYTGTDIGYFMEFDGYYNYEDELQNFSIDYADNAPLIPFNGDNENGKPVRCLNEGGNDLKIDTGITIKSDIYSPEQRDFIASYVNNVYRIMYNAAYNDRAYIFDDSYSEIILTNNITPQQAVEKVVNTQSLADMYIINEIACDADIYWSSFFMDADFGDGGDKRLTFEAPWDFDSALGNKRVENSMGFFAANTVYDVNDRYQTINPWLAVLMHEDWFKDIISEKWTEIYNSGVFDDIYSMIENDTEKYSDAIERNYRKWNNINSSDISSELVKSAADCKNQKEAAEYLEKWLKKRVEFLNNYWYGKDSK